MVPIRNDIALGAIRPLLLRRASVRPNHRLSIQLNKVEGDKRHPEPRAVPPCPALHLRAPAEDALRREICTILEALEEDAGYHLRIRNLPQYHVFRWA